MNATIPLRALAALALLGAGLTACYEGGFNTNEAKPGNQVGGNTLGEDLSLSEDGRFLVTRVTDAQGQGTVWSVDLQALAAVSLPLDGGATRMLFGDGERAYFLSLGALSGRGSTGDEGRWRAEVQEVSLATGRVLRTWPLSGAALMLSIDADNRRLAAWTSFAWQFSDGGRERPDRWALQVIDLASGEVREERFDHPTHDVRWVPSTGNLAVVTDPGQMQSEVVFIEPDGTRHETQVPNCASSLQLAPTGRMAMLAPTHCTEDPVSIIDLFTRSFRKNIPGFGPVAWSPDGETAVAFGRKADLLEVAGIHTDTEYSLLFIEAGSLNFEVLELGDDLPIYTMTPDGEVVLIYSVLQSSSYDGILLVDVDTRSIRETSGPEVGLSEFVMSPDGQLVYLIDGGLFRLDVASGQIIYISLPCGGPGEPDRCNPDLINLLPTGETLVLGYRDLAQFGLYDIGDSRYEVTFEITPAPATPLGVPIPVDVL